MTKTMTQVSAIALLVALMAASSLFTTTQTAHAASLVAMSSLQAGDLIRGESFSAVYYYGADGFRYVFPNDKAYFTWYTNFNTVKWVSDATLTKIQIGGNVTYKPGSKMIKINSDPRVYVVASGGVIRAIGSEAIAKALYGATWNKQIDDVPDGFFSNYVMGGAIDVASMYDPAAEKADAENINVDKGLSAASLINISDSGFSQINLSIAVGTAVKFVNTGVSVHGASADDGSWGTGSLYTGDSFSKYFRKAGTYSYHDKYDASKKATITVQ